jgi:hypothetical protein
MSFHFIIFLSSGAGENSSVEIVIRKSNSSFASIVPEKGSPSWKAASSNQDMVQRYVNSSSYPSWLSPTAWVYSLLLLLWNQSKENFSNVINDQFAHESNASPSTGDESMVPTNDQSNDSQWLCLECLAFYPIQPPDWSLCLASEGSLSAVGRTNTRELLIDSWLSSLVEAVS